MERPETSHDNFLRDFGERFVPGYKAVSTVDMLMNAPFDECEIVDTLSNPSKGGYPQDPFEAREGLAERGSFAVGTLLQRLYSTFPCGMPGVGLVILRAIVAIPLVHAGLLTAASQDPVVAEVAVAGGAMLLLMGLWTPVAGALIAVTELYLALLHIPQIRGHYVRLRIVRRRNRVARTRWLFRGCASIRTQTNPDSPTLVPAARGGDVAASRGSLRQDHVPKFYAFGSMRRKEPVIGQDRTGPLLGSHDVRGESASGSARGSCVSAFPLTESIAVASSASSTTPAGPIPKERRARSMRWPKPRMAICG